MDTIIEFWSELPAWSKAISLGLLIGFLLKRILFYAAKRVISKGDAEEHAITKIILKNLSRSLAFFFPVVTALLFSSLVVTHDRIGNGILKTLEILSILTVTWVAIGGGYIFQAIILHKYDITQENNLKARKIVTQASFIRRIFTLLAVIIGLALILLSFESVRKLGTGLITSAGIASIVIGISAQKPIANLLAGLQIAFTQPIRIDDAVIVENEWGWIEEITLTYVVVRIWDWRRIVLPITYFTEKPFQNWTRTEANLIGSVFLFVDYRFPVDKLREKLHEFLKEEPLWDKKSWVVQVVDCTEKSMSIRCLMSAKNAPEAWDLRCNIRERLVKYIGEKHPEFLPRFRVGDESEFLSKAIKSPVGKNSRDKK